MNIRDLRKKVEHDIVVIESKMLTPEYKKWAPYFKAQLEGELTYARRLQWALKDSKFAKEFMAGIHPHEEAGNPE